MKYSVKFQIVKRKNNQDVYPLAARVSYAGIRVDIRLGFSLPEKCWNPQRQCAVPKTAQAKLLCANVNKKIFEIQERMQDLFARCELIEHRIPGSDEVRQAASDRSASNRISEVLEMYLKDNPQLELSTIKSYRNAVKVFLAVEDDVCIGDINEAVIQDFCVKALISHTNNTVRTYWLILNILFRWAEKKRMYDGSALSFEFKYKISDKPVIYLEQRELLEFFMYVPDSIYERRAQLLYLFCCFTGLRYSDASRLLWEQCKEEHFEFVTKKTNDRIKIEYNQYSEKILEWCRNEKDVFCTPKVFHNIPQYRNEQLLRNMFRRLHFDTPVTIDYYQGSERKTVVKRKWELLTSHTARKSFVVNAITLGIPLPVVMRWTGHKSMKSMKPYTKVIDEVKAREMQKFNKL